MDPKSMSQALMNVPGVGPVPGPDMNPPTFNQRWDNQPLGFAMGWRPSDNVEDVRGFAPPPPPPPSMLAGEVPWGMADIPQKPMQIDPMQNAPGMHPSVGRPGGKLTPLHQEGNFSVEQAQVPGRWPTFGVRDTKTGQWVHRNRSFSKAKDWIKGNQ